jgi:transcriptional regulator with XRE-family HTH domain
MDTNFVDWLKTQLQERNWSQADLARESGLNKQSIHYYLTKSSKPPHAHALAKIAYALGLPVEQVYRAAGFLPRPPHVSETIEQIVYEVEGLPEKVQEEVLAFIRMEKKLHQQRKKKK